MGGTDIMHGRATDVRNTRILTALLGVLSGAVVFAAGVGRLFISEAEADVWARWMLGVGLVVFFVSTLFTMRFVRQLPTTRDDCALYGRHIVGLTFVLLVMGLCNAAGMSTLALEGGLDFSAASLIAASDEKSVVEADKNHAKALNDRKGAERVLRDAETALARARKDEASACSASALSPRNGGDPTSTAPGRDEERADTCPTARQVVVMREDDVVAKRDALADAQEYLAKTEQDCAEARLTKKRGLFFLLSVSTMTALFGAAFYVVNQVREKRPPYVPPGSGSTHGNGSTPPSPVTNGSSPVAAVTATATVESATPVVARNGVGSADGAPAKASGSAARPTSITAEMTFPLPRTTEEPFDVHKFWSGTFFRIGEAVLFTFTFFWLLWSSQRTEYAVWLPVLALFVGMFVKTGETIIFRLGMRILSAAEAFLPAASVERAASSSQSGDGSATAGATGAITVRDGKAQARVSKGTDEPRVE
jgi:hypothetical protein